MSTDDIVELNQLAYRYAAAVDNCDVTAFQAVFTADASLSVYRAGADEPYTSLQGHEQLAQIPNAMRGMYLKTAHMMTNHLVDVRGDAATGEVLCIARHLSAAGDDRTTLNIIIRYGDRYARLPDGWRISQREIRFQWSERGNVIDGGFTMNEHAGFRLEPITPAVGAIVTGVDLTQPLDAETVRGLRAAVLQHGAVFFRDQNMTREQLSTFMQNFGPLCTDPFSVAALHPPAEASTVHNMPTYGSRRATAVWHMDSTLAAEPASLLALRALELPPGGGGDTCWGSMYAAYDTLSAPVRSLIDHLEAEHSAYKTLPLLAGSNSGMLQANLRNVHPVVAVHPETGRRALYVNELWTERIVGVSRHESDCLLAMLWKHSQSPEFTMRWRWRVNDLVLWDNRSFQHYAVMDYDGNRMLQKSYVQWQKPLGVSH